MAVTSSPGAWRTIGLALLEGVARRVGEELATRMIDRSRNRQASHPKKSSPPPVVSTVSPDESGPT